MMAECAFWPIETERDYRAARERVSALMNKHRSPIEDGELDILAVGVEAYEDIHYPMDMPDPVSAVEFRLEQMGKSPGDLAAILGDPAAAARILDRSRPLTFEAICALRGHLEIPVEVLTAGYESRPPADGGDRRSARRASPREKIVRAETVFDKDETADAVATGT